MGIVNYRLIRPDGNPLPDPVGLYEYCMAANGIFVRAQRKGLYACFPVAKTLPGQDVRGLGSLTATVRLEAPAVGKEMFAHLFARALAAMPLERLWWLGFGALGWQAYEPEQVCRQSSVYPVDPYHPGGADALIDLHSHNSMRAFFSAQDDRDESGFRIFAVLGRVNGDLEIACRIGIYGHFYNIPAAVAFDFDRPVIDVMLGQARREEETEEEYDYLYAK